MTTSLFTDTPTPFLSPRIEIGASELKLTRSPSRPEWSPQAIARFFGWLSKNKPDVYFSKQVGGSLVRFLEMADVLHGKVIDYGCGPGYLLEFMTNKGLELSGADFSPDAVRSTNARLDGKIGWLGATLIESLPSAELGESAFDLAACIETLEHLDDDALEQTLKQLSRIVKPDGHIMLTTPASEDLAKATGYCAFCDSEFHSWQHVRSFSPQSLKTLVENNGWEVTFCQSISLFRLLPRPWPGKWNVTLRYLVGSLQRFRAKLLDCIFPRPWITSRQMKLLCVPGPHLVLLARKQRAGVDSR